MKKVSLIMPTYNDANTITETLESIISQTYQNWELIIMIDGSTDNTIEVIKKYKNEKDNQNRIKYYYQENTDQLSAIKNAIKYIDKTDYIYILHSDDLFNNKLVIEKAVDYLNNNDVDGIIADLTVIDGSSNIIGKQIVSKYIKSDTTLAKQLLWLGRNLYVDFAFTRYEVFISNVNENYLTWNTPFWLFKNNNKEMLNIKKVDFPFIKYRVFEENYINNDLGKLNVINGELRTATRLMQYFDIPNYKLQYFFFRFFNKIKLLNYKPIYYKKECSKKSKIIKFILEKRYNNEYKNNIFLNSLYLFYENYNNRTIEIKNINEKETIYLGSDMRFFNKAILNNTISELYLKIFEEMKIGFNEIITTKEEYEKVLSIIKFLCLYPFVKITIE